MCSEKLPKTTQQSNEAVVSHTLHSHRSACGDAFCCRQRSQSKWDHQTQSHRIKVSQPQKCFKLPPSSLLQILSIFFALDYLFSRVSFQKCFSRGMNRDVVGENKLRVQSLKNSSMAERWVFCLLLLRFTDVWLLQSGRPRGIGKMRAVGFGRAVFSARKRTNLSRWLILLRSLFGYYLNGVVLAVLLFVECSWFILVYFQVGGCFEWTCSWWSRGDCFYGWWVIFLSLSLPLFLCVSSFLYYIIFLLLFSSDIIGCFISHLIIGHVLRRLV